MSTDRDPSTAARGRRPGARKARRSRPLLVVLLVLVTSLVLPTATVIGLTTYLSIRHELTRLSGTIVSSAAWQAGARTQEFLSRVGPTLELNRDLMVREPGYAALAGRRPDEQEWRARAALFLRILRANPGFTRIDYGDRWKTFTAAHRDGQSLWVEHRRIVRGRMEWHLYQVDATGAWTSRRPPDKWFDPHQREWYDLAAKKRRLVWTRPYVFAASGRPGVTAALPLVDRAGQLAGVFGVDIELAKLSELVRQLQVGPGSRAYLLTADYRTLAHPDGIDASPSPASGENAPLPMARESKDPVLRAAASGLSLSEPVLELGASGQRYLGAYHQIQVGQDRTWMVVVALPEQTILGPARRSSLITLGWCLALLLFSLTVGAVLAARIARPLRAFARELAQVERFIIPARPSPDSSIEEVQVIGQALDRMKSSLRSFEKYVPTDLVRALVESGQEARLGGQAATLTLFFGDVMDYTATSERLSPTELVEALSEYLEEMETIIHRQDGIVDKYVGDAVMAFWGAPIRPHREPEKGACAAALEYLDRLQRLRAERETDGRPFFEACIGIHTGEALVGNIGSQRRMDYTAMGDAVNVASRLEDLNRVYGTRILISDSTYRAVCEEFEARPIDCVAVKGRSSAIQIYELLARRGELIESLRPLLNAYAEGLRHYRARQWEAAEAQFLQALELGPDGPSRLFAARCQAHLSEPPPAEWDGVHVVAER